MAAALHEKNHSRIAVLNNFWIQAAKQYPHEHTVVKNHTIGDGIGSIVSRSRLSPNFTQRNGGKEGFSLCTYYVFIYWISYLQNYNIMRVTGIYIHACI